MSAEDPNLLHRVVTLELELMRLRGSIGGSGISLSDADPEDIGTTTPGTATAASRADHVHAIYGYDYGRWGHQLNNGRFWGTLCKDANGTSTGTGVHMNAAAALGSQSAPVGPTRMWDNFQTSTVLNNPAGWRQTNSVQYMWIQAPRLMTLIQTDSDISSQRIWHALTDHAAVRLDQASSNSSNRYVGLRYDTGVGANWYLCSSDGSTASETDTGVPVVTSTEYFLDLDLSLTTSLVARINGVAFTKTSNLPSGTNQAEWQTTITTLTAAARQFRWHHTMLERA